MGTNEVAEPDGPEWDDKVVAEALADPESVPVPIILAFDTAEYGANDVGAGS
jgi:hypothetical protein